MVGLGVFVDDLLVFFFVLLGDAHDLLEVVGLLILPVPLNLEDVVSLEGVHLAELEGQQARQVLLEALHAIQSSLVDSAHQLEQETAEVDLCE